MNSESLQIKQLTESDLSLFKKLIQLNDEVFEMVSEKVDDAYLSSQLKNPSFVAFVAVQGETVLGSLTGYVLPMYRMKHSEFFLYDLAVKREYQRQGIATQLIQTIQAHARKKGLGDIFLDAHEVDTHALAFYRATGAKGEKVIQFTYETK